MTLNNEFVDKYYYFNNDRCYDQYRRCNAINYRFNENCQINENRCFKNNKIEMTKTSIFLRKRYRFCVTRRIYLSSKK